MNTFEAINYNRLDRKNLLVEIASRDSKIQELEEQLSWFKRQIFGKRSERVVSDLNEQQLVFEGFESLPTSEKEKKLLLDMNVKSQIETVKTKFLYQRIYQSKPRS
ncbi:MAG: transposase domain-containing protein [Parachlamydiaceae bacterium]